MPTLTPTLDSTTDMPDTMLDTLMPTTMARGPLMLSQRPMPTATTATMDKFSASEVQSRSSKRTSLLVI